jgi:pimeloyl-ACP methyl ester carboxylesterase
MHVEQLGDHGPRLLLIHGSTSPGWATWSAQRELAEGYRLVVPHRTGYPPNPPLERIDFDVQAREMTELIEPGTHVVGHSYGGVIALLAAGLVPERVRSLCLIEPPALGLARGNPQVEAAIAKVKAAFEAPGSVRETFVRFLDAVGARAKVPDVLTPAMEASVRATLVERFPFEAVFDFDALRAAAFPILVVSGGHDPAAEAVCDVLQRELQAERVVIRGAGHGVQRTGGAFNARLRELVDAAEARTTGAERVGLSPREGQS